MLKIFVFFLLTLSTVVLASNEKGGGSEDDISLHLKKKRKKEHQELPPVMPVQECLIAPPSTNLLSQSEKEEKLLSLEKRIWGITDSQVNDLFNNTSGLFCIFSPITLKFMKVSKDLLNLLGYSEEFFLSNAINYYWHPDDAKRSESGVDSIHKKTDLFGFQNRYRCANGSYCTFRWTTLTGHFKEANSCVFGVADDITPQQDMIHGLYRQLQKKNKMLNALDRISSAYLFTSSGANPQMKEQSSLLEKHRTARQIVMESFLDISNSCQGIFEEVFYNNDHCPFIEHQSTSLVFNKSDLFKQERMGCDIDKSLISYFMLIKKALLNSSPLILQTTPFWKRSFSDENISTLPQTQYNICMPLITQQGEQTSIMGIVTLSSYNKNYSLKTVDKLKALIERTARIVYEKKMEQWQHIATIEKETRLKAEEANTMKSTFVSHMSHELRTPLNGIMGFLELALREDNLTPVLQDYLNNAYTSTQALKAIANDILDLSKIETDAFKLEIIPFNPLMIAQEVSTSFKLEADKKNIQLKLKPSMRIPQVLLGDPLRFRQILFNLVGNALKFTSQGEIVLTLDGITDSKKPSNFLFVGKVKDTGIGMTEESVNKLFKPFVQADSSIMRKYGGTGLGLFITKQLCEKMEGSIKVSSVLNLGTTFEFKLLLGHVDLKQTSTITPVQSSTAAYQPLPALNILIAEDNIMNQLLFKGLFSKEKCQITLVNNGSEAVDMIKNTLSGYDLILMDGEMPVMDGLEATRLIREFMPANKLPIIGLTGHAMTTHRELFMQAGMTGYLTKPINKQTLFNAILEATAAKDSKKESRETDSEDLNENSK